MDVVGDENEQNLAGNWHQNQYASGFRVRRSMEQRPPGHLEDLSMRRNDSGQRALVEHRWDFAGLHRDEIAADAVDDRLEDDEAGEFTDGALQHQASHAGEEIGMWGDWHPQTRFGAYPLMNKAESTGIHPLFNTGRVYRLRNTIITQNGNKKQYTAITT